jgi:HK97 family phage prohead protease
MGKEYKQLPVWAIKADPDTGEVEALVAAFGNMDYQRDVILDGAFKKTITERGAKVRVLDNHNAQSVRDVVGKVLGLREVGRKSLPREVRDEYPDATGGLVVDVQFLLDTPEGLGVFKRIKSGAVSEYSIGYDAIIAEAGKFKPTGYNEELNVRYLKEIRLWEVSPVVFAANPATATVGAKALKDRFPVIEEVNMTYKAINTEARTPQYDGTSSGEWDRPALEDYISGYWKHHPDADRPDEEITEVGDMPEDMKSWTASLTLLGNADAETFDELSFFPVVDPDTMELSENALLAVVSGRGAQADIAADTLESARDVAYTLLEDEFDFEREDEDEEEDMEEAAAPATLFEFPTVWAGDGEKRDLTRFIQDVRDAFSQQFRDPKAEEWEEMWVASIYEDAVIAYFEGDYYRVPYEENDEGEITFVSRSDWQRGSYEFVADEDREEEKADEARLSKLLAEAGLRLVKANQEGHRFGFTGLVEAELESMGLDPEAATPGDYAKAAVQAALQLKAAPKEESTGTTNNEEAGPENPPTFNIEDVRTQLARAQLDIIDFEGGI